ncbi:hypothetical protein PHMEG_00013659 [Phytophthora megakarya]|uniref:Uncharacterized protein n=1 Tax=Phytophthora megakarya TaxID=4795 RepID=A0A225W5R2_9STRA|nr:hypothetical protein PHMEG_00013659 [Phytophthora megakarya]
MHRAEKASSKICRAREVEKAQEVHRKKITGVKSHLHGIIPKSIVSRSSTSFHLRPTRSTTGNVFDAIQRKHSLDEFQRSLAKMEEFRGVAPVPGLGSDDIVKIHHGNVAAPPTVSRRKSLNAPFRTRRLKEIKVDNAEVYNRIRKCVSHYSNDDLRRDWQKNVAYLSSISEFPNTVASRRKQRSTCTDESRSCFGSSPRQPGLLSTTSHPESLPRIPAVAHPIKSIPSPPKKLQLNMTPGFRSLRKAMPQQPSLPPIPTPHSSLDVNGGPEVSSNTNNHVQSPRRERSTCPSNPGMDDHFTENTSGRSSTAVAPTKFVGDLCVKKPESENSGDAKYQLLKTGRFVGGTYLVLTVLCGDGVTNPYGFDVFAYNGELQCEYKLSITKAMTHELLDKSSSSSLAAETAAAAGTNLSMPEIARRICDHISFALLGTDQGEMIFLVPSLSRKIDQAMRFDASPGLVAFCLHQCVEITSVEVQNNGSIGNTKKRAHVFALTHPVRLPSNTKTKIDEDVELAIRFQVFDSLPTSRCTSLASESGTVLKVEAGVDDLYSLLFDSAKGQKRTLSMERMAIAAIQHLHIISVPSNDPDTLRNELILNSHINTQLQPCPSRSISTATLKKKRSRQHFLHSTSQIFTMPIRNHILIQSGLVWRNCYLLAEVALDAVEEDIHTEQWSDQTLRRKLIQDVNCDLIVSVFNSNSGRSTCRRISPQSLCSMFERLRISSFQTNIATGEDIREQHVCARYLVTFLQLDLDLFGHEVIVFPALEHTTTSDGNSEAPDNIVDEVTPPEEHAQEFLIRQKWEDGNISEGDERSDSSASHDEEANNEAEMSAGVERYNTDEEEEQDKADASYDSYTNHDEADNHEDFEDPQTKNGQNPAPDDHELTTRSQWRQGRKIHGHFCLLQGFFDNFTTPTTVVSIGSSGQLETSTIP